MNDYDQKYRWGGILECPLVSKVQRNLLDGGRNRGLSRSLAPYQFRSVIDLGCGLGETSKVFSHACAYYGLDNSFERIRYASQTYRPHHFFVGDACKAPLSAGSCEAGLMIDVSHHLSDEMFRAVVKELGRVSRRYVIVSDPVLFKGQGALSRFFYRLDRGSCFRTHDQMLAILGSIPGLAIDKIDFFSTFPYLYRHVVICLRVVPG
ncbi:MAG TPA: methyltransferase domain-containing protein [Candidatus Bathyarchaeia archaeon]|nr:methyltransferase domain-containing protein [Candidatus Bathyarchaeia archaeon]